jgi:hypothetical protein
MTKPHTCPNCLGTGLFARPQEGAYYVSEPKIPCPACKQTGVVWEPVKQIFTEPQPHVTPDYSHPFSPWKYTDFQWKYNPGPTCDLNKYKDKHPCPPCSPNSHCTPCVLHDPNGQYHTQQITPHGSHDHRQHFVTNDLVQPSKFSDDVDPGSRVTDEMFRDLFPPKKV